MHSCQTWKNSKKLIRVKNFKKLKKALKKPKKVHDKIHEKLTKRTTQKAPKLKFLMKFSY